MRGAIHEALSKRIETTTSMVSKCRKSHQDLPKVKMATDSSKPNRATPAATSVIHIPHTKQKEIIRLSSEDMRDWPANCMVAQGTKREKKILWSKYLVLSFFISSNAFYSFYDRSESLMLWLLALTGVDVGKEPVFGLAFCLILATA